MIAIGLVGLPASGRSIASGFLVKNSYELYTVEQLLSGSVRKEVLPPKIVVPDVSTVYHAISLKKTYNAILIGIGASWMTRLQLLNDRGENIPPSQGALEMFDRFKNVDRQQILKINDIVDSHLTIDLGSDKFIKNLWRFMKGVEQRTLSPEYIVRSSKERM